MKKNNIILTYFIFGSLLLGILVGFMLDYFNLQNIAIHWIAPFGDLFLRLLKMIAVPIVFLSVVQGIINLGSLRIFKKMFIMVLLLYVLTTIFAISMGLLLGNTIEPGKYARTETLSKQDASYAFEPATNESTKNFLRIFLEIVPENIVRASSENSNMIQVIFVAFLLSIVILVLPAEKTDVIRKFFEQLYSVFLQMAHFIILLAPIGVFALMTSAICSFGAQLSLLHSLGLYAAIIISSLLLLNFFIYPLIVHTFTSYSFKQFLSALLPAQIVAFTTSSSALTLPVTKQQVEEKLQVNPRISSFVLPLGMTINMDGTSLYQSVAILFIAQLFGIEISLFDQIMIVFLVLLASIGAPGIPGGSIVMLIMILSTMNLPLEGLALILGLDRPLDMFRTTTNVTGDAMICCLLNQKKFINYVEKS